MCVPTHVDDCLILGDAEYARATRKTIASVYNVRDSGFPSLFLGVEMRRTADFIELTNTKMIDALIARFDITPKMTTTPMPADTMLTADDHADTRPDSTQFRQMVGPSTSLPAAPDPTAHT